MNAETVEKRGRAEGSTEALKRVDGSFPAMGTYFEYVLYHPRLPLLTALVNEIQEEVSRLEARLSRFQPTSEVSRINRLAGKETILVDY